MLHGHQHDSTRQDSSVRLALRPTCHTAGRASFSATFERVTPRTSQTRFTDGPAATRESAQSTFATSSPPQPQQALQFANLFEGVAQLRRWNRLLAGIDRREATVPGVQLAPVGMLVRIHAVLARHHRNCFTRPTAQLSSADHRRVRLFLGGGATPGALPFPAGTALDNSRHRTQINPRPVERNFVCVWPKPGREYWK